MPSQLSITSGIFTNMSEAITSASYNTINYIKGDNEELFNILKTRSYSRSHNWLQLFFDLESEEDEHTILLCCFVIRNGNMPSIIDKEALLNKVYDLVYCKNGADLLSELEDYVCNIDTCAPPRRKDAEIYYDKLLEVLEKEKTIIALPIGWVVNLAKLYA